MEDMINYVKAFVLSLHKYYLEIDRYFCAAIA